MTTSGRLLHAVLATMVAALLPSLGWTQAYPTKPIRIVVGFAAGGPNEDALESIAKQDMQPATGTPEELAALVRTEVPKWAKVVKSAGIRAE